MAEFASRDPGRVGSALKVLMSRDRWHAIPVIAADELSALLRVLLASGLGPAQEAAQKVINDLGAIGHDAYRSLLMLPSEVGGSAHPTPDA
jgi:hypothetical protein